MILSHSSGEGINYFHFSSCCLQYIMFDMCEVDRCMLHLSEETKIICFCWGEWFTLTSADGMQSSLFDGCVPWEACVGGAGQQGKTLDCCPVIPCITIMWQIKKPWTLNLEVSSPSSVSPLLPSSVLSVTIGNGLRQHSWWGNSFPNHHDWQSFLLTRCALCFLGKAEMIWFDLT